MLQAGRVRPTCACPQPQEKCVLRVGDETVAMNTCMFLVACYCKLCKLFRNRYAATEAATTAQIPARTCGKVSPACKARAPPAHDPSTDLKILAARHQVSVPAASPALTEATKHDSLRPEAWTADIRPCGTEALSSSLPEWLRAEVYGCLAVRMVQASL